MATQVLTQVEPQPLDVVVIDDEETFTEGCRQTLEVGGYRSAVARNGAQGLRLVHSTHPKVVLVDLKMPGMNGTEVLRELSTERAVNRAHRGDRAWHGGFGSRIDEDRRIRLPDQAL